MSGIPFIRGREIYLRHLLESDSEGPYPAWFNDAEVCSGNSHYIFPYTLNDARAYIQEANRGHHHLILAIVCLKNDAHIGNVALDNINYINRTAELTIVIGDKDCWKKGYGKEAVKLICDHGFISLNLNRIACGTFENNTGMCKLAEYLGMREEGRRRNAIYKHGRYLDIIEYGILRNEYIARFKHSCI